MPRQHGLDDIDGRFGDSSKARLRNLFEFAQIYRGWTSRETAEFLRRDVHNVIPGSGVPKADLLLRLAEALDWPPNAVLEEVCGEASAPSGPVRGDLETFAQLNHAAYDAFAAGRFDELVTIARRMHSVASSPEERATACLREYGGWDGLGRYEQALTAVQRGLREAGLSSALRSSLLANLASVYHALGRLAEAEGIATTVIDRAGSALADDPGWRQAYLATARYVRGQARRSGAVRDPVLRNELASLGAMDFREGESLWSECGQAMGVANYDAAAFVCGVGAECCDALAGHREINDVVDGFLIRLDSIVDTSALPPGWWAEVYGWCCVFGAELLLVRPNPTDEDHRKIAIFTNKGYDLAEHSGHWALRERILTIEHVRRTTDRGEHVTGEHRALDADDMHLIAGVMARFPAFRPLGWELVQGARRV